jgi:hypothetical protein
VNAEELSIALRQQPFQPFRVCLTDGQAYDIYHPEWCMPSKRLVIIGVVGHPSDPLFERRVYVDPFRIVRLEPLAKTGPGGNGPVAQPAN